MAREITRLTKLVIDEISVLDHPANSEIDANGEKVNRTAIAIWRRDSGEEGNHMGLKTILKSANVSRDQICQAVRQARWYQYRSGRGETLEQARS